MAARYRHCSGVDCVIQNGVDGEVYNIGGGQECENIELTRNIIKRMDRDEAMIKFVKDRPGHDFRYSLDISKLKSIKWRPKYELQEGLKLTIEWYKENEDWWRPLKEQLDSRYSVGFWGNKEG